MGKPVLTSPDHHDAGGARFHIDTLGGRGLYYRDEEGLVKQLLGFDRHAAAQRDWNAHRAFEPGPVMERFEEIFLTLSAEEEEQAAAAEAAAEAAPAGGVVPRPASPQPGPTPAQPNQLFGRDGPGTFTLFE